MDKSTNDHVPKHDHDSLESLPTGWRWSLPRVLGFAGFLAMLLFWIWAFANRDSIAHPDTFDDPAYVVAAESVCAPRQANIGDLPLATAAKNAIERGELLELGTIQLELMVAELGQVALPTDPKGADGVRQWLKDYELFLNDRRVYAEVLATGEDPPFLISGNDQGVRVTDLLTTFAEVNEMLSCAPSGDI
ncbi:MAG: hypothetical protein ACKVIQ_10415 [Acidimicrobiales bacterium]